MSRFLKNNIFIILWVIAYVLYIHMAFDVSINQVGGGFDLFLFGNLFTAQKYFVDVSNLFLVYLFILKKPFTEPMFVVRCKTDFLLYIFTHGLKICGLYIIYTIFLFYAIPILYGIPVFWNMEVFVNFVNLFSFLLATYLLYVLLLLKTDRQMIALLTGFVVNSIILIAYFAVGWVVDTSLAETIGNVIIRSYPIISVMLVGLVLLAYRRKEFLA